MRYLAKDAFGSYAYALAVATLMVGFLHLGLPESVSRFVPMYRREGRIGHALGTLALAFGVTFGAGLGLGFLVLLYPGVVSALLGDPEAARLLAWLIFFVPVETSNLVLQGLFASLGRTRSIFWRQMVLVPMIRLAVALFLVLTAQDAIVLAAGYTLASAAGLIVYVMQVPRLLSTEFRRAGAKMIIPVRRIVSFAFPVVLSGLFFMLMTAAGAVALGALSPPAEVASFQAVSPPARLNYLALTIFLVLYIPTLATVHAAGDRRALRRTHATSVAWMIALTAPLLTMTTAFSPVLVETLFGLRYASSWAVLALLAGAYYIQTVTGLNDVTLRIHGRLREVVWIDLSALALGASLTVGLVAASGAVGAAAAALTASLMRAAMYAWAVGHRLGLPVFAGPLRRLQVSLGVTICVDFVIERTLDPPLWAAVVLAATTGIMILWFARGLLRIGETFPELIRPNRVS